LARLRAPDAVQTLDRSTGISL